MSHQKSYSGKHLKSKSGTESQGWCPWPLAYSVIWVVPYPSLVLGFEETTWWIMRKNLMSVLSRREVPHTYPLDDFPDGLTLASKGCAPIWRLEFQGGAK